MAISWFIGSSIPVYRFQLRKDGFSLPTTNPLGPFGFQYGQRAWLMWSNGSNLLPLSALGRAVQLRCVYSRPAFASGFFCSSNLGRLLLHDSADQLPSLQLSECISPLYYSSRSVFARKPLLSLSRPVSERSGCLHLSLSLNFTVAVARGLDADEDVVYPDETFYAEDFKRCESGNAWASLTASALSVLTSCSRGY